MNKTSMLAKAYVKQLRFNATPAERKFCRVLAKNGFQFVFQRLFRLRPIKQYCKHKKVKIIQNDRFYIADFYLPEYAIVIEIDGKIHNGQFNKDLNRTLDLIQNRKMVHNVLRFSNTEIAFNPSQAIATLNQMKRVRGKGTKINRSQNKDSNNRIAQLNEVRSIIQADNEAPWIKTKHLLYETPVHNQP